jgi:hypothetical protein
MGRDFSLRQEVQTDYGSHPANVQRVPGHITTIHLHLMPILWMSEAIPPLPHTSWFFAWLNTGVKSYLCLIYACVRYFILITGAFTLVFLLIRWTINLFRHKQISAYCKCSWRLYFYQVLKVPSKNVRPYRMRHRCSWQVKWVLIFWWRIDISLIMRISIKLLKIRALSHQLRQLYFHWLHPVGCLKTVYSM